MTQSEELFKSFAFKCLKPTVIKNILKNLSQLDFDDEKNLLDSKSIIFSSELESFIRDNFKSNEKVLVMLIKATCRKFCVRVCKEIINRLPNFNKDFDFGKNYRKITLKFYIQIQKLNIFEFEFERIIDPQIAMNDDSSLNKTFIRFEYLVLLLVDQDLAHTEWSNLKLENIEVILKDSNETIQNVTAQFFWQNVFGLKDQSGKIKLPFICKIIKHILTLLFGTALVERDFSLTNIISKLRNRLTVQTLDALMRVRENIPDNFSEFLSTEEMFNLFNSNIYKNDLSLIEKEKETDEVCFNNPTL